VLFFDEADAIFGSRTTVGDAHDRYAAQEVDYLLKRLEAHRGLAILGAGTKEVFSENTLKQFYVVELSDESAGSDSRTDDEDREQ
jgi:SpoVK/Ycf46/Vps4 family AAA+-type ATPase